MSKLCGVLIAVALLAAAAPARADDVAVVVNKANPMNGVSMAELRKILLGQEAKWPSGQKIVVLMTTPGQPDRGAALKIVCGMNETDFTLHFMHASFNGESGELPKAVGAGAQVRQAVASTVNALGLFKASEADSSVKILTVDGASPGQPGYKLKLR
jgi:hypothetical protein